MGRPGPLGTPPLQGPRPRAVHVPCDGPARQRVGRGRGELAQVRPQSAVRQRQQPAPAALTVPECKDAFARAVAELVALGYFEEAFGSECDDSHDDPAQKGQQVLADRLGLEAPFWPLTAWADGASRPTGFQKRWSTEVFFDVIEALDELVARPRQRRWHDFHRDWDYEDYARGPGQAVYRWRVNELLAGSIALLRLAESGLDAGLLVSKAHDDRDQLADRVLETPDSKDRAEVGHAIKLFRGRDSGREDKRSALTSLGRVLEARRPFVEASLRKKDSAALFQIANEFDLRHRRADKHDKAQRDDYDEAFLDWIYWWYLGTIELTDTLRTAAETAP